MESIGASHETDCCEPGCQQQHAFHYVRVRAHEDVARRPKGAVDLKLDLHPRMRVVHSQALLRMTPLQLEVRAIPGIFSQNMHCEHPPVQWLPHSIPSAVLSHGN